MGGADGKSAFVVQGTVALWILFELHIGMRLVYLRCDVSCWPGERSTWPTGRIVQPQKQRQKHRGRKNALVSWCASYLGSGQPNQKKQNKQKRKKTKEMKIQ